jgi:hypothetical protein
VWISEETAIISLSSLNWLVFITETEGVYSAVRTGSLNKTYYVSSLKDLKSWLVFWAFSIFFGLSTSRRFGNGDCFLLKVEKRVRVLHLVPSLQSYYTESQRRWIMYGMLVKTVVTLCQHNLSNHRSLFPKRVIYDYKLHWKNVRSTESK